MPARFTANVVYLQVATEKMKTSTRRKFTESSRSLKTRFQIFRTLDLYTHTPTKNDM